MKPGELLFYTEIDSTTMQLYTKRMITCTKEPVRYFRQVDDCADPHCKPEGILVITSLVSSFGNGVHSTRLETARMLVVEENRIYIAYEAASGLVLLGDRDDSQVARDVVECCLTTGL